MDSPRHGDSSRGATTPPSVRRGGIARAPDERAPPTPAPGSTGRGPGGPRGARGLGAVRIIGLGVVGILCWTAFSIVRGAATGIADWLIALAAPVIVILRPKWNPVFVLLAAGIAGVVVHY